MTFTEWGLEKRVRLGPTGRAQRIRKNPETLVLERREQQESPARSETVGGIGGLIALAHQFFRADAIGRLAVDAPVPL